MHGEYNEQIFKQAVTVQCIIPKIQMMAAGSQFAASGSGAISTHSVKLISVPLQSACTNAGDSGGRLRSKISATGFSARNKRKFSHMTVCNMQSYLMST